MSRMTRMALDEVLLMNVLIKGFIGTTTFRMISSQKIGFHLVNYLRSCLEITSLFSLPDWTELAEVRWHDPSTSSG